MDFFFFSGLQLWVQLYSILNIILHFHKKKQTQKFAGSSQNKSELVFSVDFQVFQVFSSRICLLNRSLFVLFKY